MSKMVNSEARSPFVDRMFNLLPQGHEEALTNAFYNVAVVCFLVAGGGAAMAVYFILQPFLKPLLWAILVGSVLHPLKHKVVVAAQSWLVQLNTSETPLVLRCFSAPIRAADWSTHWIGSLVLCHWKFVVPLLVALPVFHFFHEAIDYEDLIELYQCIGTGFLDAVQLLENLPVSLLCSLCLGFSGTYLVTDSPSFHQPRFLVKALAHSMWLALFCLLANVSGSFKIVFLPTAMAFMSMAVAIQRGWICLPEAEIFTEADQVGPGVDTPVNAGLPCTPRIQSLGPTPVTRFPRILREHGLSAKLASRIFRTPAVVETKTPAVSGNRYIHGALMACVIVLLWQHIWLFHLVPIPLIFYVVRSLGSTFGVWGWLKARAVAALRVVSKWTDDYKDDIFPQPLQWIYEAILFLDRVLINWLIRQVDVLATAFVILVVVMLTILFSLFLVVQMYGESVHLVHFGTRVFNETLTNPHVRQWLPHGFDQTVSSVVGNAYTYGQRGIANYVRDAFQEEDPVLAAKLEKTVLDALDRLQGAWMGQDAGKGAPVQRKIAGSVVDGNATTTKPPLLRRMSQDLLNVTVLMNFGSENVGMIMSIGQSVWSVLKENISLVMHSATALISVLTVGGNFIVNFLVNGVVFLTALFYLLVPSDHRYKPAQLISLMNPGSGNTLGTAIEEAVNTVCLASVKLAAFYGLWTWLIHTVFQVNFVVIPAATAALLGAVPFLGTYWAALPAALDLWLAQHRGAQAVLLMVFQFVPTLLVDATFYAEIKGGGHPYLTGLAVAGGIFWLGFEGAIIGPLLLCVLLVGVSVYTSFMTDSHVVIETNQGRLLHRRLLRTGTIA